MDNAILGISKMYGFDDDKVIDEFIKQDLVFMSKTDGGYRVYEFNSAGEEFKKQYFAST